MPQKAWWFLDELFDFHGDLPACAPGAGRSACQAMTRDEFNTFCAGLPATTHVVQWGNSDVWKVGGKVFALCGWYEGGDAFTFKAGDIAYEVMKDEPGIRPAPYLASRGMKWLQVYEPRGMSDESLKQHLVMSYKMVVAKLTKKMRAELGV